MLVGLIADTHIPFRRRYLPPEVFTAFKNVDLILHAGDLNVPQVLDVLTTIAPVVAVAGNGDEGLVERLGVSKTFTLGEYVVGLTHGHLGNEKNTPERALNAFPEADVIVFGHSHIPYVNYHGGTLLVNPGSPTDKRRQPHFSVGLLHLKETISAEIIRF